MSDFNANANATLKDEKGYESDGGSSVVILVPVPKIHDVHDLSLSDDEEEVEEKEAEDLLQYQFDLAEMDAVVYGNEEWNNQDYPEQFGAFDNEVVIMDEGGNIYGDENDQPLIKDTLNERGLPMQQRKFWNLRYVNPSTADLRRVAKIMRTKRGPNGEKLTGPLSLEIDYYFKPTRNQWDYWHTKRPDLDNMVKFSMDAMQQAGFFEEDCQVCRLVAQKTYCDHDEESRVEYQISSLHL